MVEEVKTTKSGKADRRTRFGKEIQALTVELQENKNQQSHDAMLSRQHNKENFGLMVDAQTDTLVFQKESDQQKSERDTAAKEKFEQLQIEQIDGVENQLDYAAYQINQAKEKSLADTKANEAAEKRAKEMAGETGLKGIINATKDGLKKLWDSEKTMAQGFGDLKGAFSNDISMVTGALSPLMAIPGVSTAIAGMKLILLGLFKGFKWLLGWLRRRGKQDRLKKIGGLGTPKDAGVGKVKLPKSLFLKFIGITLALIVGLGAAIGAFFGKITAPFRTGGFIFKMFGSPKWITTVGDWFKGIFGKEGKIANLFLRIKNLLPPKLLKAFALVGRGMGMGGGIFSKIVGFMKGIGSVFGKLFWPITALMSAWEAIKGFIEGFKDTQGGMVEKIIGGVYGAIGSLVDFIIMVPLDLIKDLIVWIGEKMGADMGAIKDFSFSEMWNNIWGYFTDAMLRVVKFFKALGAGAVAAIGALAPFGESPMEAFKRKYAEVMSEPAGLMSVSGGASNQEAISMGASVVSGNRSWQDASKNADDERARTGVNANNTAIDQSTTIHTTGTSVYMADTNPVDSLGASFARN